MTFFLNSHLGLSRSLRSNENWCWILRLWPLKFCNHSWQFGSSPQKGKVDLCKTNGSKVLIYLTLLNFPMHYLQEYSKIWNLAKSNKSELWNRLSLKGLRLKSWTISQFQWELKNARKNWNNHKSYWTLLDNFGQKYSKTDTVIYGKNGMIPWHFF
jgi:hypothetical protein